MSAKKIRAQRPGLTGGVGSKYEAMRDYYVVLRVENVHSNEKFLLGGIVQATTPRRAVKEYRRVLDRTRRDLIVHDMVNCLERDGRRTMFKLKKDPNGTNPTDTPPEAA
jgi:hypothetical protein